MAQPEHLPIHQAREGQEDAWTVLFSRFRLPVFTYVRDLVGEDQAALDIVQETFLAAVRALPQLREDAKFGAWLFRIAHQKVLAQWRRSGRAVWVAVREVPEGETQDLNPAEALVEVEDAARFTSAMDALPLPQRSLLLLVYLEGFSLAELSQIHEVPVGTIKSRLHSAKRALRSLLERTLS